MSRLRARASFDASNHSRSSCRESLDTAIKGNNALPVFIEGANRKKYAARYVEKNIDDQSTAVD